MSTLTLELEDQQAARLADAARERGVAVTELLREITTAFLTQKHSFDSAAAYVLQKNAELYRRLAQVQN